ncbi:MAG: hypothetical protein ACXADU_06695 [Promethearchaeota archaeon]|jgi:hypothetical protein
MSDNIDLDALEKKTWRTTLVDGIFEIYLSILHLSLTLGIVLDEVVPAPYNSIISYSVILVGLIFFLIAKKYISQPRLGKVKFGRARIVRKLKTVIILTINFLIVLTIYLIGALNPQFRLILPPYLYGLIIGLLFVTLPLSFVAYFLQFTRLYIIALLFGLGFFLDELFALLLIPEPFDSLLAFGMISVAILCIGLVVFVRFLRKYPLPKEENS